MGNKKCTRCSIEKSLDEFDNNKTTKDGKASACKTCLKEYKKEYYLKNKTKILKNVKNYSDSNKEKIKDYQKKYFNLNKENLYQKQKEYKKLNDKEIKNYLENYRKENKEKIKSKNDIYRENNKNIIKIKHREIIRNRRKTDNLYRLKESISKNIRMSFKRANHLKKGNTLNILGCSFVEFKTYLESLWEPWMNWDNYGKYKKGELNYGWDIDHYVPIKTAKTVEDVIKLNHYTNLQPLCSYYNRNIKRDVY
jgi:hypothetical protein